MRLVEDSWLPQAKRLAEGARKYINHTCGGGKTLVISANEDGWSGHCFRCSLSAYVPYGLRPMKDLTVIRKKEVMYANSSKCVLPEDFTLVIPPEYRTWLSKNSIFTSTALHYKIGYSPSLGRIILPMYEDGELVFQQARAVESWRKPKYLNQGSIPKINILYRSDVVFIKKPMRVCCITEDIASCIRVGMFIPAVCTLGTSMSTVQAAKIAQDYDYAIWWYDSDAAGIHGAEKGIRGLQMLGVRCDSVQTPKDAKLYTNAEIVQQLTKGVISGRNRYYYSQDYEGKRILREDVPELTIRMLRRKGKSYIA